MKTIGQFIENLKSQLYEYPNDGEHEQGWNNALFYVIDELNNYDKSVDLSQQPTTINVDTIILENQRLVEQNLDLETTIRCLSHLLAKSEEDFAVC